ncbi:MAG: sel1 repeat family protein [Opitutae bacterium]|nr:sel1 repeat family protein [Opitutae bacterium]
MKIFSPRLSAVLVFSAALLAAGAAEVSLEELQAKADGGDVPAIVALAEHYRDEVGGEEEALRWYRLAAAKGHAGAQLEFGLLLRDGRGTTADPEEAFSWLLKSAGQGERYAMTLVAGSYVEGEMVKKNLVQALRWYRSAAEKGDANAAFEAGAMLADGRGTKRDPLEAAKWLAVAARAGIAEAHGKLATLAAADPQLSAKLAAQAPAETKRLLARATAGEAPAQFELAQLYAAGAGGLLRDRAAQVQWLQKAAAQGLAPAQNALGLAYEQGEGIAASPEQAFVWLKKSADQRFPAALLNLSRYYLDGREAPRKNRDEAARLMRHAAELGSVEAMVELGNLHRHGGHPPKSDAITWFVRAAQAGDVDAMLLAGYAFEEDADDLPSALKWYRAAAEKDNSEARDRAAAVEQQLAERAFAARLPANVAAEKRALFAQALRGDADAQRQVGEAYRSGSGVPEDIVLAQQWFAKAGAQGQAEAKRWAEQLKRDPKFEQTKVAADFAEAFMLAPDLKRRKAAVEQLSRSTPSNLSDAARAEFVCRLLGPKMDANSGEAGDYVLSISLLGVTFATLQPYCSAATLERIRAHAVTVTASYEARLAVLRSIDGFYARAKAGESQAQFRVGEFYLNQTMVRDVDVAADWFKRAAAQGHAEAKKKLLSIGNGAQLHANRAYNSGQYLDALHWFTLAAEWGSPGAAHQLAVMYRAGIGLPAPRPGDARKWFEQDFAAGNWGAAAELAEMCEHGEGGPRDPARALQVLREAAAHGEFLSITELGRRSLMEGADQEHDRQALEFFRRPAAKDTPAAKAWITLVERAPVRRDRAQLAFRTASVTDEELAGDIPLRPRDLLDYAAHLGHAEAQRLQQVWHPREIWPAEPPETEQADKLNKAHKYAEARPLWERAAGQGSPTAALVLGRMLVSGVDGVPPDVARAQEWFEQAGRAGLLAGYVNAENCRAEREFDFGLAAYTAKDLPAALRWWTSAAERGDPPAMFNVGVLHEQGEGVPKDVPQALAWYERAAVFAYEDAVKSVARLQGKSPGGDALAQARTARQGGKGAEAIRLYEQAAAQGSVEAMGELGDTYSFGVGVPKDEKKALVWFEKAVAAGDKGAATRVAMLKSSLALKQLLESQDEMKRLQAKIDGTPAPQSPATTQAPPKDLRKKSPWTADQISAALKEGVNHDSLAEALTADGVQDLYDLDVARLRLTPAGQGIGRSGKLAEVLRNNSHQGAGAWTFEMAKAKVDARRAVTGRRPEVTDSPELRALVAAGDAAALYDLFYYLPETKRTQGDLPQNFSYNDLRDRFAAAQLPQAAWLVAEKCAGNADAAKNDPVRQAELLFQSAEAGDPRGMRALGMLFLASGEKAVATNYAEAEYWLIEAAARAPQDILESAYENPGRDAAFLYSFAVPMGGPLSWPLTARDDASLRWAREMIRRSEQNQTGPLAGVANFRLDEAERKPQTKDARARMAALPPEVPLWSGPDRAKLEAAAQGSDIKALLQLAAAYATSRGVHQNDLTAVRYYEAAAAKGDNAAMLKLAEHTAKGMGVKKDKMQALAWTNKAGAAMVAAVEKKLPGLPPPAPAAASGKAAKSADDYYGGFETLGRLGMTVAKTEKDRGQIQVDAFNYLKEAVKIAETGKPETQYRLATYLIQGLLGIPKDPARGRRLLAAAAKADFAPAKLDYARALQAGAFGFAPDAAKSQALLSELLAGAEDTVPEARHQLAMLLFQGAPGVPADKARALRLLDSAADEGFAASQFELGRALIQGLPPELPADPTRGIELLKRCANQGAAQAAAVLGEIYERGVGTAANPAEALQWYQQALAAGLAPAKAAVDRLQAQLRPAVKK